jgi:hypothetical protein
LYNCVFYTRPNGRKPCSEFIDTLSIEDRAVVYSKINTLRREGKLLIATHVLERIKNLSKKEKQDKELYELICGRCRVGTYFDAGRQTFVFLFGWEKTQRIQPADIAHCRSLLHEYLGQGV